MPKACLIRGSKRHANIHTAGAIRRKWQTIDGTTGIIRCPSRANRLRTVHPRPTAMDTIDTIRAHSHNSNTPIARQTAMPARSSSENPPATPIPAIATEAASPESPPVISITGTTKKRLSPQPEMPLHRTSVLLGSSHRWGVSRLLPFLTYLALYKAGSHRFSGFRANGVTDPCSHPRKRLV